MFSCGTPVSRHIKNVEGQLFLVVQTYFRRSACHVRLPHFGNTLADYLGAELYRKYHLPVLRIIGQPRNTVNVASISTGMSPIAIFRQKLPRRQAPGEKDANGVPCCVSIRNFSESKAPLQSAYAAGVAMLSRGTVFSGTFFWKPPKRLKIPSRPVVSRMSMDGTMIGRIIKVSSSTPTASARPN